ncbi:MAG: hypothetical protein ABI680_02540 [Chthoniobacteraceae bacterium]
MANHANGTVALQNHRLDIRERTSLLRAPDAETREKNYAQFVEDLRIAARLLEK